jgi:hypothetical protein
LSSSTIKQSSENTKILKFGLAESTDIQRFSVTEFDAGPPISLREDSFRLLDQKIEQLDYQPGVINQDAVDVKKPRINTLKSFKPNKNFLS